MVFTQDKLQQAVFVLSNTLLQDDLKTSAQKRKQWYFEVSVL